MPWPKSKAVVDRLEHLQQQEMLAVLNSDRNTMVLCRLAWADVYRTEVLDLASGVAGVSRMLPATLQAVLDTVPAWKRFRKARPLRLVVKREPYDVKFGYDSKGTYYKEFLICGHVLHLPEDLFGEPAPKRRRCAQCAEIALGAKPNVTSTNATQRSRAGAATPDALAVGDSRTGIVHAPDGNAAGVAREHRAKRELALPHLVEGSRIEPTGKRHG